MTWRRLLVLDLILVAAIVAGALRMRQSWRTFEATHRVEFIRPEKENNYNLPPGPTASANVQDWTEISVKNPFSFDRTDVSIVAPKVAPVTQPKPILFGTMEIGDQRIAMLASTQAANRSSRAFKVGDSLDDWQLVEIRETSVIMTAANGVRETIIVNDPKNPAPRNAQRTGTAAPGAAVTVMTSPQNAASQTGGQTQTQQTAPPSQTGTGTQNCGMLQTPFGPVPKTCP